LLCINQFALCENGGLGSEDEVDSEPSNAFQKLVDDGIIPQGFTGVMYRLSTFWQNHLDLASYEASPINYLEIGCFHGKFLLQYHDTILTLAPTWTLEYN
jgi:hypothetical protein